MWPLGKEGLDTPDLNQAVIRGTTSAVLQFYVLPLLAIITLERQRLVWTLPPRFFAVTQSEAVLSFRCTDASTTLHRPSVGHFSTRTKVSESEMSYECEELWSCGLWAMQTCAGGLTLTQGLRRVKWKAVNWSLLAC